MRPPYNRVMHTAAILVVGDEILAGEVRDENAPYLVKAMSDAGVRVVRIATVGDEREAIVAELGRLRALADAVVVSGGIGPTHDDVTRPAIAAAVGLPLEVHAEAEQRIRSWYGGDVNEAELSMALLPRHALLLDGQKTTTFGFRVSGVYVLPGVPYLFRDIGAGLVSSFSCTPRHRVELTCLRREGEIASALAEAQAQATDVSIGSYPLYADGQWRVRVVLRADDEARVAEVARRLGPHL